MVREFVELVPQYNISYTFCLKLERDNLMVLLKENIVSLLSECSDPGSTRAYTVLLHVGYFD